MIRTQKDGSLRTLIDEAKFGKEANKATILKLAHQLGLKAIYSTARIPLVSH
jgi:hypothetical protein